MRNVFDRFVHVIFGHVAPISEHFALAKRALHNVRGRRFEFSHSLGQLLSLSLLSDNRRNWSVSAEYVIDTPRYCRHARPRKIGLSLLDTGLLRKVFAKPSYQCGPRGKLSLTQRLITLGFPITLVPAMAAAVPQYSDDCPYFSAIVQSLPGFTRGIPLQAEEIIRSPSRFAVAKVIRTDDVRVTYDKEEAHIEITSAHFPPLRIRVQVFRALEAKWVTDRILLIWRDMGPATTVEELIDVMDRKWLSQKCVDDDKREEN